MEYCKTNIDRIGYLCYNADDNRFGYWEDVNILEKFFALSEQKQVQVINAALQHFGKHGYEKASINDIAMAAHISKASVFQYFGSKKQLYRYLLDYTGKIITDSFQQSAFEEDSDLFDRVLESSLTEAEILKKNPYISQFIASAWAETAVEASDTLAAFREETSKFRTNLIMKEKDAVKFKNPNDAETVFQILMLMAEGYAARCRSEEITEYDVLVGEFQKMIAAIRRNFYKEEYLL